MADNFSHEEIEHERQCLYPPPPGCAQGAFYASRSLRALPAAAAAANTAASSSSSNNNNNDDLAVARAGPATAVPNEAIDPRLLPPPPPPPPTAAVAVAAAAAQPGVPAGRPWTTAEDDALRTRRHAGEGFATIGPALNRTAAAAETRAKWLGIYKNNRLPRHRQ